MKFFAFHYHADVPSLFETIAARIQEEQRYNRHHQQLQQQQPQQQLQQQSRRSYHRRREESPDPNPHRRHSTTDTRGRSRRRESYASEQPSGYSSRASIGQASCTSSRHNPSSSSRDDEDFYSLEDDYTSSSTPRSRYQSSESLDLRSDRYRERCSREYPQLPVSVERKLEMASLLIGAGVLAYDKVQTSRQKRKEAKMAHNQSRFEELERENRERVGRLNGGYGGSTHQQQQQQQSFYAPPAEPRLRRRESRTSTHSPVGAGAIADPAAEEAPPPAYEDVVRGAAQSHSRRAGGNSTEAVRAPEIGGGGRGVGVDRGTRRRKSFFGRIRRGTWTEGDGVVR